MKILIYITGVFLLFVGLVRYVESKSIFYPGGVLRSVFMNTDFSPENVFFLSAGRYKLHGWFVEGATEKIILFFHGNAGNISDRFEKIQMFRQLGHSIFIIDYRGYGRSEGRPTEKGMYLDAQGAYDYLVQEKNVNPKNIIVYGASLGGAAAIDLASKNLVGAVIADSTFSNAKDMAKRFYPFIPSFLLGVKLDSIGKVKDVTVPKLFIHSGDDEIIPIKLGQKLFKAAPEPKKFIMISGGHNDGYMVDADKFIDTIKTFIEE